MKSSSCPNTLIPSCLIPHQLNEERCTPASGVKVKSCENLVDPLVLIKVSYMWEENTPSSKTCVYQDRNVFGKDYSLHC